MSNYTYSRALKNFGSLFIIQTLLFKVMPSAIKLNGKTDIMAVEIQDISANRTLPTELETAETAASQEIPQQLFCVSLLFAKLFGKNQQFWRY